MKKIIKCSVNYFWFALALSAVLICGCSCSAPKPTPDPLAGWKLDFAPPRPSDGIIEKDYQDYIQNLPPKGPKVTALGHSYEDGKGQHAVMIDVFVGGTASWTYIFIYDKDNNRIQAIKYRYNKYQS
jgi:hypothetical protein